MKSFKIELPDDIAVTYEEIAKLNEIPVEELLQSVLAKIIETHKKAFCERQV